MLQQDIASQKNQKLNEADFLNENFTAIETGKKSVSDVVSSILKNPEVEDKITSSIEANMIGHQSQFGNKYIETFEANFLSEMGIDNKARVAAGYEPFSIKIQSAEEYKQNIETFNQTVNVTAGANVALPQIVKTNFSNLLNEIFFDTGIWADITSYQDGADNEEIREITNIRNATAGNETTALVATNDTVETILLNPNRVRAGDMQFCTRNFQESKNPVDASTLLAMKMRSVRRRTEQLIFGSNSGTTQVTFQALTNMTNINPATRDGQIYSIMNNLAISGANRGALVLNPIGQGIKNHIDALNWAIGSTRGIQDVGHMQGFAHYMNFRTAMEIFRTMDTQNTYYFNKVTGEMTSLLLNIPIKIVDVGTLLDWQVVTGKMKNVRAKKLNGIKFETNIVSLENNRMEMVAEVFFDAAPINCFKNIPNKNNFTAMLLPSNGVYTA